MYLLWKVKAITASSCYSEFMQQRSCTLLICFRAKSGSFNKAFPVQDLEQGVPMTSSPVPAEGTLSSTRNE